MLILKANALQLQEQWTKMR